MLTVPRKAELEAAQERVEILDLAPEAALLESQALQKFGLSDNQQSTISEASVNFIATASPLVQKLAELPMDQLTAASADIEAVVAEFVELDLKRTDAILSTLEPEQLAMLIAHNESNKDRREQFIDLNSRLNEGLWFYFQGDDLDVDLIEGFMAEARQSVLEEKIKLRLQLNEELASELSRYAQKTLDELKGKETDLETMGQLIQYAFYIVATRSMPCHVY